MFSLRMLKAYYNIARKEELFNYKYSLILTQKTRFKFHNNRNKLNELVLKNLNSKNSKIEAKDDSPPAKRICEDNLHIDDYIQYENMMKKKQMDKSLIRSQCFCCQNSLSKSVKNIKSINGRLNSIKFNSVYKVKNFPLIRGTTKEDYSDEKVIKYNKTSKFTNRSKSKVNIDCKTDRHIRFKEINRESFDHKNLFLVQNPFSHSTVRMKVYNKNKKNKKDLQINTFFKNFKILKS